jgi:excisionase family DNA binding protein
MESKLLSTGQAAKVCSVTPDTILKWIRSGRLPAQRTAGGHHRVDRRDLDQLLKVGSAPLTAPRGANGDAEFRFCWEHKGDGCLLEGCEECVVYALRAQRCYEVVKLQPEVGHAKLFCQGSCEDCDYYKEVHEQATNMLVVTDDPELTERLKSGAADAPFNLEFATCEYDCSALVHTFRPDFALVDCSLGPQRSADITAHLATDPRLPFVRVILAGTETEFPKDCEDLVFARIHKPFRMDDLAHCTTSDIGRSRRLTR